MVHEKAIPTTSFKAWLKQIWMSDLNETGRKALDTALPHFAATYTPTQEAVSEMEKQAAQGLVTFYVKHWPRERRFAGDFRLGRGCYYTIAKDKTGDDSGTLVGELNAYYDGAKAGAVLIGELPVEGGVVGLPNENIWAGRPICLIFFPKRSRFSLQDQNPRLVALTTQVSYHEIDEVIDLRIPEVADWFTRFFSTLEMEGSPCFPFLSPLSRFDQLIPTLLSQVRGGHVFTQIVGTWLRKHGVSALIYPSARASSFVRCEQGRVADSEGWCLVDYRGTPPPISTTCVYAGMEWASRISYGDGLIEREGYSGTEDSVFSSVKIHYEDSGRRTGSWEVFGLREARIVLAMNELIHGGVDPEIIKTFVDMRKSK